MQPDANGENERSTMKGINRRQFLAKSSTALGAAVSSPAAVTPAAAAATEVARLVMRKSRRLNPLSWAGLLTLLLLAPFCAYLLLPTRHGQPSPNGRAEALHHPFKSGSAPYVA